MFLKHKRQVWRVLNGKFGKTNGEKNSIPSSPILLDINDLLYKYNK